MSADFHEVVTPALESTWNFPDTKRMLANQSFDSSSMRRNLMLLLPAKHSKDTLEVLSATRVSSFPDEMRPICFIPRGMTTRSQEQMIMHFGGLRCIAVLLIFSSLISVDTTRFPVLLNHLIPTVCHELGLRFPIFEENSSWLTVQLQISYGVPETAQKFSSESVGLRF